MNDTVINAGNVGKKFSKNLKHVMAYGISDIARNILGIDARTETLRSGEFWAVEDVSFDLKRGDALGIIGPNGSGKTTMLKMLNGIFMPDRGRISMGGKTSALIQVGAGFHPMLTGRENIYVNGSVLGMGKKEIDRKFDSIVEFADIGDFLDTPVKHYSSGMFVRLGFSVAIHCEPEILLIDEILAVGDVNFRKKCAKRMKELLDGDVSIVFVTHDLGVLRHICSRAICLRDGKVVHSGDIDGAIDQYMASPEEILAGAKHGLREIKGVTVMDGSGKETKAVSTGERCSFEVNIDVDSDLLDPVLGLAIYDSTGTMAIGTSTRKSGFTIEKMSGANTVRLEFPYVNLIPGTYKVITQLYDSTMGTIDRLEDAAIFQVHSKNYSTGYIFPEHKWSIRQ